MTVSLRVVGNFYHHDGIKHFDGMTVADVLTASRDNPGGGADLFNFDTGKLTLGDDIGKPSITAFVARYPNPVISKTSKMSYPKGEYYIQENVEARPIYTVFQYYVFTGDPQAGGAYIPNKPRINSYADAIVPDGGFVVWRLVSVLAGENKVPPNLRRKLLGGAAIA